MTLRPRRIFRVLVISTVSLVVTLALVEGGYRAWLSFTGHPHVTSDRFAAYLGNIEWLSRPAGRVPAALTEEEARAATEDGEVDPLASVADLTSSVNVLSPYVGIDLASYLDRYVLEGKHFASERAEEDFDLLVLGGSVAGLVANHAKDSMASALASDPRLQGRHVRVWNQARGGFKAPQTSILLGLLFQLGWQPDAVILIDGFNELAMGNVNRVAGASPLYPSFPHWAHLAGGAYQEQPDVDALIDLHLARRSTRRMLKGTIRFHLYRSAVCSKLIDVLLTRPRARASRAMQALEVSRMRGGLPLGMRGPVPPVSLEATLAEIEMFWTESSVDIDAMCRARGIAYLHVLQPTLYDEGAKPITPNELRLGKIDPDWKEAVVAGYPGLREALGALEERGVATYDASMIFSDWTSDLYYDCCHFTRPGSEKLAAEMIGRLLAVETLRPR